MATGRHSYAIAFTMELGRWYRLYADCLLRCASDLDGVMETTCDHDPIKTAMEERQARERERYQRQTAFAAYRMSGKSSYNTPYGPIQMVLKGLTRAEIFY